MEASSPSAEERAAERSAALKAAKYGLAGALIGALIGGAGSFLGAYMTYRAQTQTHTEDVKTAAYGQLVAKTQDYRADLREVADAATAKDQETYVKTRVRLIELANDVHRAATTVYILSEDKLVVRAANHITDVFFKTPPADEPVKVEDSDPQRLLGILGESGGALSVFLDAARADLTE